MDQWMLAHHGSAAKGSDKDLEVAGSGPIGCPFSILSSFLTICSSLTCHMMSCDIVCHIKAAVLQMQHLLL